MNIKKHLSRTFALVLMFTMVVSVMYVPAMAAENITIVLEDVTDQLSTTLKGEAKIKVSVRGAAGSISAVQTALKFTGKLKYKSIEFLCGENNPPQCFCINPNAALVNSNGTILPGIITNNEGKLTFTDDKTELFILTFAGDAGDSVTLSLDSKNSAGTYLNIDGDYIYEKDTVSVNAKASSKDNEGIKATVRLEMNVVNNFLVSNESGYVDSGLFLHITNEKNDSVISTAFNTVSIPKGGHYDNTVTVPTFVVENTVVAGDKYTVEITGNGYVPYKAEGVTFEQVLEINNEDFIPGDVNSDGMVNGDDKAAFDEVASGNYDNYNPEYADFNRDGYVDEYDDIFEKIGIKPEPEKTAPAKMDKPSLDVDENEILITWKEPDDGGSKIEKYIIEYGTDSDKIDETIVVKASSNNEYTLEDLEYDTKYYVQISAKNEIGLGETSAVASITTEEKENSGGGGGGGGGGGFGPSTGKDTLPANPATPEGFTDLGNHTWAKDAIYELKSKGIISGVSATEFAPGNNITRGDFVLILVRMLEINDSFDTNFEDVPVDSYYYNAIGSAKAAGIAAGDGINFMPTNTISRQDLITLAYRAFRMRGYIEQTDDMTVLDSFTDKANIAAYASEAMASMVKKGIIMGSDGMVNPTGNATRAEVAVMCARLSKFLGSKAQ